MDPTQFVRLAEKGITGKHPEPRDGAAASEDERESSSGAGIPPADAVS